MSTWPRTIPSEIDETTMDILDPENAKVQPHLRSEVTLEDV